MKTKILIIVAIILSASYLPAVSQNSVQKIDDKDPAYNLDFTNDPKLTQADIDMLIEAAKGAPVNAEPVKDDRLPSEELIAEGVYHLAPANAEPIDYKAEHQRERELVNSKPAEVHTDASESVVIHQELPEKPVEVTNYRDISGPKEQAPGEEPTVPNTGYPKGSQEQPLGNNPPK